MGGVSESCLGGQAARNYVLPHNYQIIFTKSNTIHQLTLVLGALVAQERMILKGRGLQKCLGGQAIQLCLTIINAYFQNQTQFTNLR